MSNTIVLETEYLSYGTTEIDLPENKTWNDVEYIAVKWNSASIFFKEKPTEPFVVTLNNFETDTKRPNFVRIFNEDYSKQLYEDVY